MKMLIKNQLKEMGSAKITMSLWVRWRKPIKMPIDLDPEDLEDVKDTEEMLLIREGLCPL